jgi:hypothetical protein
LAIVVAVILWLQAADENSALGDTFSSLDKLVDSTVQLLSSIFDVRSFTKSWLTSGFWIAYVCLACLLILFVFRASMRAIRVKSIVISRQKGKAPDCSEAF